VQPGTVVAPTPGQHKGSRHEMAVLEVQEILDLFSDAYCNKHLVFQVIELLVVRLMPEIAEKTTAELLAEKLDA